MTFRFNVVSYVLVKRTFQHGQICLPTVKNDFEPLDDTSLKLLFKENITWKEHSDLQIFTMRF